MQLYKISPLNSESIAIPVPEPFTEVVVKSQTESPTDSVHLDVYEVIMRQQESDYEI